MKGMLKSRLAVALILSMVFSLCIVANPVDSNAASDSDFVISGGVLKEYKGNDATVVIPDTVNTISREAFATSYSCKKIIIPASVTKIEKDRWGYYGFSSNLEEFEVSPENTTFDTIQGILSNKEKTAIVYTPRGSKIKNLVIPDSVKDISEITMYELKSITFGANTEIIKPSKSPYLGSWNSSKLTKINVSASNKKYSSKDGVLYSKDQKKIIRFPAAKKSSNYKIGSKVTTIGYAAFASCDNVTKITVPKSVKKIEGQAFAISTYKYNSKKGTYSYKGHTVAFKGKAPKIEKGAFAWANKITCTYPKKYKSSWKNKTKKYKASDIKWKAV